MTIQKESVDMSYVTVEQVTFDKSHVIMTHEKVTVDSSYAIMTIGQEVLTLIRYNRNRKSNCW